MRIACVGACWCLVRSFLQDHSCGLGTLKLRMEVLSKARNAETVEAATVAGVNAVIEEWLGKPLPRLSKGVPPCPQARPSSRPPPPEPLPPYPLLVISPPACLKHSIPGHFERPARLTAILHALHPPSRLPFLPPPLSPPPSPPLRFSSLMRTPPAPHTSNSPAFTRPNTSPTSPPSSLSPRPWPPPPRSKSLLISTLPLRRTYSRPTLLPP
ncbi:hypothetical protein Naga_100127g22 [Nannochloropsis gaditana]|uniref:Uncharacterized protein n=1 Tax=Nannochloropsis gaditana TaxID=72520 RepID=W7TLS1_9STRA|nr:hypothetical protein Naga_100127g22 [Nannochloropsis gaditana]